MFRRDQATIAEKNPDCDTLSSARRTSTALTLFMNRYAFEKLVRHSLRRLPRKFKQRLKNISIEIDDAPSAALLRDMQAGSGMLFGLYQGVPLTEREWNYGNVLPDRIVIYQRPIEAAALSPEDIETIVLDTVMHEIGHYFGFDDDTLYSIESEKSKKIRKKNTHKNGSGNTRAQKKL